MTEQERLQRIHKRLRESHRVLFQMQSKTIASLHEVLNAVAQAHDEMAALYETTNDLEDEIEGQ